MSTLNSAVSHHVQTADTQRQVEINTDVTSTEISETETTTTRTLENLNRSRVLNFVFRQLLQEYYTLTYLDGVSLMYSNGYDTSRKTGTLSSMANLLRAVLVDDQAVESVRNDIFVHLCNIPDYTGTRVSFIEKVAEKQRNCIEPATSRDKPVSYVRKRKELTAELPRQDGQRHHPRRHASCAADALGDRRCAARPGRGARLLQPATAGSGGGRGAAGQPQAGAGDGA